jgi:hypothetical protein
VSVGQDVRCILNYLNLNLSLNLTVLVPGHDDLGPECVAGKKRGLKPKLTLFWAKTEVKGNLSVKGVGEPW